MKFNSRMRFTFIFVAFFSFLFLIIPFNWIVIPIRFISLFITIFNTLSGFYVFNIKYKFIKNVSSKFILILQKLKLYNINREYWIINFFHAYTVSFFIYIISILPQDKYDSIMTGIFSSAITSIIIFHITFIYERYKFKQRLYELFQKLFHSLNNNIDKINLLLKMKNQQFDLTNLDDNIKYIEIEFKNLYTIINELLFNLNKYDDISFMSIDAYNNIISNKKIKNELKLLFIKILNGAINIRLVKFISMTQNISHKLSDNLVNSLKIVIMINETKNKLIKTNFINSSSNDIGKFFELLKEINQELSDINKIYEELFKEFEIIFKK